jgi:hypothetical protein
MRYVLVISSVLFLMVACTQKDESVITAPSPSPTKDAQKVEAPKAEEGKA